MRWVAAALSAVCVLFPISSMAAECPGNPQALGTSRVLVVDPAKHARVGSMQYPRTLPLADKEVVLTFDDGPLPAYTGRVLEALAAECVKATFFMVGSMARAYPEWVRRVYNAGHTVATHTQRHPGLFDHMAREQAIGEIESGIAATKTALGDSRALAPFFRFPGLRATRPMEQYLATRGIMVWSADVPSDDWRPISAEQVVAVSLARLRKKGGGVLLMHDIQARTALALPELLRELKARGYRIVHVVPSGLERPLRVEEPEGIWVERRGRKPHWPVARAKLPIPPAELPVPSALSFGFPHVFAAEIAIPAMTEYGGEFRIARARLLPAPSWRRRAAPPPVWPEPAEVVVTDAGPAFPVPGVESIDPARPIGARPPLQPGTGIVAAVVPPQEPEAAPAAEPAMHRIAEAIPAKAGAERPDDAPAFPEWTLRLNWSQ